MGIAETDRSSANAMGARFFHLRSGADAPQRAKDRNRERKDRGNEDQWVNHSLISF